MVAYTKPQQRKQEGEGYEERVVKSSLLILDLRDDKFAGSRKEETGNIFRKNM